MNDEERQLWRIGDLECVMISCCAGAELQMRRVRLPPSPLQGVGGTTTPDTIDGREVVLREMYPMKSDLYERARDLKAQCERAAADRK